MKRSESKIFSSHLSGPRTPTEIEIARARHHEHERLRAQSTFELERQPGHDALVHYLQRKGRGADCTDEIHCDPRKYEPVLMNDLLAARRDAETHPEQVREVREVVWAGSWRKHKTHDPMLAARLVGALREGVIKQQLEAARINPSDAADATETIKELEQVEVALRTLNVGPELEAPTRVIEDWYAMTIRTTTNGHLPERMRKQAEKELNTLRLIRDELYYSLLFPNWATTRNAAMRQTLAAERKKVG